MSKKEAESRKQNDTVPKKQKTNSLITQVIPYITDWPVQTKIT